MCVCTQLFTRCVLQSASPTSAGHYRQLQVQQKSHSVLAATNQSKMRLPVRNNQQLRETESRAWMLIVHIWLEAQSSTAKTPVGLLGHQSVTTSTSLTIYSAWSELDRNYTMAGCSNWAYKHNSCFVLHVIQIQDLMELQGIFFIWVDDRISPHYLGSVYAFSGVILFGDLEIEVAPQHFWKFKDNLWVLFEVWGNLDVLLMNPRVRKLGFWRA